MCGRQQIEDEVHFLLHYPFYDIHRQKLFSGTEDLYSDQLSDTDKIIILMNDIQRLTAKYLLNAFEQRKTFLYSKN